MMGRFQYTSNAANEQFATKTCGSKESNRVELTVAVMKAILLIFLGILCLSLAAPVEEGKCNSFYVPKM